MNLAKTSLRLLALLIGFSLLTLACSSDGGDDEEAIEAPDAEAETDEPSNIPEPSGPSPNTGDNWHVPYGIYVCDDTGAGFIPPFVNDNEPDGIGTEGDGIIYIHPFNQESSGEGATVAKFLSAMGLELTDEGITPEGGETVAEGFECEGEPTVLQIARWQFDNLDGEPEIITENLADVFFTNDNEVITIAYAPEGAEIEQPPTITSLALITDVAPEDVPVLPDGFTVAVVPPPGPGATLTEVTTCPDETSERTTTFAGPPPTCIEPDGSYDAVFMTNQGVIRVALDTENTPNTVNNFAVLAGYGYYDGTSMFRTDTSIDIIQGGSPSTNSASDPGPGYTIADEGEFVQDDAGNLTGPYTYVPGDLVMARSAGPDASGAQYFFSAGPNTAALDGQGTYIKFGETVEGLEVLEAILDSHVDDPTSGLGGGPGIEVVVESIEIVEAEG